MKDVIIWGYAFLGRKLYRELLISSEYHCLGFADNDEWKQNGYVNGMKIQSLGDLLKLKEKQEFGIIIAVGQYGSIGAELERHNFVIEGIYTGNEIMPYCPTHFSDLDLSQKNVLYAGDICDEKHLLIPNLFGLSINKGDEKHIYHNIEWTYPLPDNSIFGYQAEDVLEHISYENMVNIINEIWRILRPGCVFRISLPDYNSPWLSQVVMRDESGKIICDVGGGSGHLWFPTYDIVKDLLSKTKFEKGDFLCYYTNNKELIYKEITDTNGPVKRVHQKIVYSIVVDCYKN